MNKEGMQDIINSFEEYRGYKPTDFKKLKSNILVWDEKRHSIIHTYELSNVQWKVLYRMKEYNIISTNIINTNQAVLKETAAT